MIRLLFVLALLALLLLGAAGCDEDDRLAEASRQLVEADAKARTEVIGLQRDLQKGQAALGQNRDELENDRRDFANQRNRDLSGDGDIGLHCDGTTLLATDLSADKLCIRRTSPIVDGHLGTGPIQRLSLTHTASCLIDGHATIVSARFRTKVVTHAATSDFRTRRG